MTTNYKMILKSSLILILFLSFLTVTSLYGQWDKQNKLDKYSIQHFLTYTNCYLQDDTTNERNIGLEKFTVGSLKITGQVVAGAALGAYTFTVLFRDSNKKITVTDAAGWFVGSAVGVSVTGKIFNDQYNILRTFTGGLIGGILGIPMLSSKTGSGYFILAGTLLGEIVAYHIAFDSDIIPIQSIQIMTLNQQSITPQLSIIQLMF